MECNSATLGNDSILKTILKGNVGIGTSTPTATLHTAGTIRFSSFRPVLSQQTQMVICQYHQTKDLKI